MPTPTPRGVLTYISNCPTRWTTLGRHALYICVIVICACLHIYMRATWDLPQHQTNPEQSYSLRTENIRLIIYDR